jgi:hypothetical protein
MSKSSHRNALTKLVAKKKLTPQGAKWITQVMDPFHDSVLIPTGAPDGENSKTIVIPQDFEYTISCPASVTTGTWDAHIFTLPAGDSNNLNSFSTSYLGTLGAPGPNNLTGMVNFITGQTGTSITIGSGTICPPAALDNTLLTAMSRVVGVAFEITNTTAEISLQGEVFGYRMPQVQTLNQFYPNQVNGAYDFTVSPPSYISRTPPATLADVQKLTEIVSWEAARGSYSVARYVGMENPLQSATNFNRGYSTLGAQYQTGSQQTTFSTNNGAFYNLSTSSSSPATITLVNTPVKIVPIDTTGVWYTGLSLTSTLMVRVRYFVEYLPVQGDGYISKLAVPSPLYDPFAIELYSKLATKMPAAVPANANHFGDWWNDAMDWITNNSPIIGEALGTIIPQAQLIGRMTAVAANQMKGHAAHVQSSLKQIKNEMNRKPAQNAIKKEVKKDIKKMLK